MSRFRTIELSDPIYEQDGLRLLTFHSPALKGRGDVTLFVPAEIDSLNDVPLVLLLHGVYGSHWVWAFKGGAHVTARALIEEKRIPPMILAMPSDGLAWDGTGYLPHLLANYEEWIVEDVVECVSELYPCLGVKPTLFLAGLSMGGYGALRLGAKYSNRVRGISAHSAVTGTKDLRLFLHEPIPNPPGIPVEQLECLYWLEQNRSNLPPLRLDCGRDDHLIESNRQLHRELRARDIAHEYYEYPGGHSWPYWREHLTDSLLFFSRLSQEGS